MGEEGEIGEKVERKVVSRGVAIGLGVAVAVLLVCLVAAVGYSSSVLRSLQNQIIEYENQITNLQNQIQNLQNQIETKNSQIYNLQSQISDLQNQVNELNKIVNLGKTRVLVDHVTVNQPAGSYVYWRFPVDYAGYLVVTVHTSTTTNTYVRVIWSSHGVNYDETIRVGSGGTARFPVLPGTIEVRVGNTNLINGATETVTITYYY
mgnify:CR=1 FL=1